jgi:hypothetical protein
MPNRTLLIATTPLTILAGAGVARASGGRWRLVVIEDFPDAARWLALLEGWRDLPFESVERLPGRATEALALAGQRGLTRRLLRERIKRTQRRVVFARLAALDQEFQPDAVAVGNDRRPETQFALHLATQRGHPRPGIYLDDGLFSYVGDVHGRVLTRTLVDTPLKRLAWGSWWQGVAQAGCSRWIARAWLALPALALDHDPGREHHELPRAAFGGRALLRLAIAAWRGFGGERPAPRLDAIFALPHSDLLRREPTAMAALRAIIDDFRNQGAAVAVKHHPRELHADPLGLAAAGVGLLPAGIAFELLLPLVRRNGAALGEASTALLAARWLRPDLHVYDLGLSNGEFARRAARFLARTGVQPVPDRPPILDAAAPLARPWADQ